MTRHTAQDHAVDPMTLLKNSVGYIPVDVEPTGDGYDVTWLDVGDHHFKQTKFLFAIRQLMAQQPDMASVKTDLGCLTADHFLADTLYPTGFIFHMSRCGSTLTAKALARAAENIVIDEGTPLNDGLWHYLTAGWQQPIASTESAKNVYRNLLLTLGRRRKPAYEHFFVKFRSWNVLFIDFITQVFPDVPCLFLYRDPIEVFVSATWSPVWTLDFKGAPPGAYMTGATVAETAAMDTLTFLTYFYKGYLQAALEAKSDKLCYLNYDHLTKENFPKLLRQAFSYSVPGQQMAQMQAQFDYYSKDDSDSMHFISDKEAKQQAATQEIRQAVHDDMMDLYAQLEQSQRNLAHWL